jgi:hypothetical protein
MKIQSRNPPFPFRRTSSAKGLIFAALVLPLGIASLSASADGIQMLPPVTEATKLELHPTVCPLGGVPNVLTWDGTNPVTCATGVVVSGGQVGIGTTIPQGPLDVENQGNGVVIFNVGAVDVYSDGISGSNNSLIVDTAGSNQTLASDIQLITKNAGTSFGLLNVPGNQGWQISGRGANFGVNQSDDFVIAYYNGSSWVTASALWITPSGNVGIGMLGSNYALSVEGTAYATGAEGALSDRRHKKDIRPYALDALDIVGQLKPVTFFWKEPKDDGMQGRQIGFIAQDVQPIIPEAVLTQNNDEKTLGLKYDSLIPILTKGVQELYGKWTADHNELAALKADDSKLKADDEALLAAVTAQRREIDELKAKAGASGASHP